MVEETHLKLSLTGWIKYADLVGLRTRVSSNMYFTYLMLHLMEEFLVKVMGIDTLMVVHVKKVMRRSYKISINWELIM